MNPQTIDTYNKRVKEYDEETYDFWDMFPRTFLEAFATAAGEQVIDIGSGPGRDAVLLKELGKSVTCLDAAAAMVERTSALGFPSVLASFDELPFGDESFDGVWAYTSLLHVPKAEVSQPLAEIYRVLVPGGIFALGLIEGEGEGYRESSGVDMPRWFSYYQKDEVLALCAAHGFELMYDEVFTPRTRNYMNFIFRKV